MNNRQGLLKPFLALAAVMLRFLDRWSGKGKMDPAMAHDLRVLYPQQELQQVQWEFRVKRLGMSLAVLGIGILSTLWTLLSELSGEPGLSEKGIPRGNYGEGEHQVQLEVQWGEYGTRLEMAVGARVYSEQELCLLAEEFREQLPRLILQENEALHCVREDLNLAEEYEGYPFQVSWYSTMPEYMERTGRIGKQVSSPTVVKLQAVFFYEALEWEQWLEITLQPGGVPEDREGRRTKELKDYLEESEQTTRNQGWWQLPTHWEGQALTYRVTEQYLFPGILGIFVVASILVFILARKDLHQKYLERQQQLKSDYPELLHQLTLYLGAGLTIRGSLQKINEAYVRAMESQGQARAAFEEVGYVCRELATGVPEIRAYENWSRRTGLAEYTQLCTLLVQNLQKGSTRLTQRLREEGEQARKEYLRQCKKKSEEAQTKLLLPLVLMLVVVMLFILIPAFSMAGI